MNDLYIKLELEFSELDLKILKLKIFIDSDKYKEINEEQQSLLFIQHESMRTYGSALVSRMKNIMKQSGEKQ